MNVELTGEGGRLLAEKRDLVTRKRRALFDSLTAEERESAEQLLRRLASVIDDL